MHGASMHCASSDVPYSPGPSRGSVRGGASPDVSTDLDVDAPLVSRIRIGDSDAFGVVFNRYYEQLVRFAAVYLHALEPARETVSDVFLNIWRKRESWAPENVQAYLYGAVRNRVQSVIRDRRTREHYMTAAAHESEAVGMGRPEVPLDMRAESEDIMHRVWQAIARLGEGPRLVLMLRWHDHLGIDEIAQVLGTSVAAVHTQHSRALKLLRAELGDVLR